MKISMQCDIAIVGAGLVGASLAAALKHSGLSLAVIESAAPPAPNDDWDSRIYAISPGSRGFLSQIGAWQRLPQDRIAPIEEMRVFGDAGSSPSSAKNDAPGAKLEFSAYQAGVTELACTLEGRALQHALWEVLQEQDDIDLIFPARCRKLAVTKDAAELTLEDGRILNARLVVGADGRNSWVRNQAGLSASPVDYNQMGVVANFSCELPHRGIAHQWFFKDGILALLPLPGNRVSMVWSASPEKSDSLLALVPEELSCEVGSAAHHTLGKLELITPAAAFPLRMMTLPNIVSPRVALIGDAAHNMHPLAGQGVNTGFRDARLLSRLLNSRGACTDPGDAQLLRRYERKRREDIYTMQTTTYGLKHLFCNDDPFLRFLRNAGLDVTNRIAPLKKLLMQHALN